MQCQTLECLCHWMSLNALGCNVCLGMFCCMGWHWMLSTALTVVECFVAWDVIECFGLQCIKGNVLWHGMSWAGSFGNASFDNGGVIGCHGRGKLSFFMSCQKLTNWVVKNCQLWQKLSFLDFSGFCQGVSWFWFSCDFWRFFSKRGCFWGFF